MVSMSQQGRGAHPQPASSPPSSSTSSPTSSPASSPTSSYGSYGDLLGAIRAATAGEFDIFEDLGRAADGADCYLARELATGRLVALRLERDGAAAGELALGVVHRLDDSVPGPGERCPLCYARVIGWHRHCPTCGTDVSGVAPAADAHR